HRPTRRRRRHARTARAVARSPSARRAPHRGGGHRLRAPRAAPRDPRPPHALTSRRCAACADPHTMILYMTTPSLAEARANLSKLVESALVTHERFEVTRNGDRVAVLLSADDYDALLETVDILSRPEEVDAIRRGLADLESGDVTSVDE